MLTDGQASAAEAADKDYKLADANGLYLFVTRSGFKSWRMKYRFGGKEKRLTFGPYPEVTLAEARERRDQARRLLRDQIDPALERQRLKAAGLTTDEPETSELGEPEPEPELGLVLPLEEAAAPTPPVRPVEPVVQPTPSARPPVADAAGPPRPATRGIGFRGTVTSSLRPGPPLSEHPVRAGLRPTAEPVPPPVAEAPSERPRVSPAAADAGPSPVPAEDEPTKAVPFTPEVATGSRALSLLRQAEDAVAEARRESRSAKRIAAAVLALFLLAAVGFVWWLAHQTHAAAPAAAMPVPAKVAPASTVPPAPPATGSASPALAAPASAPPAAAAPVAAVHRSTVRTPGHARARHRRHRHRRHQGRQHRRHSVSSIATPTTATRHPHAQEIIHDVDVTAPRRADAIDPALDRYGRASLCLRAAYSADPGCAALRGAGRQ
jgi:hypothetical protein